MTAISLRPEATQDHASIFDVTEAAFRDMPYADGDEAELVGKLRDAGDLMLSLVAENGGQIVGHIAFSPVTISDGSGNWYGLGPVSVTPELHGQGIGFRLVQRGIADMRALGAKGIVLLGDPKYYGRFGFRHEPQLAYPGPPAEYFQCMVLEGDLPSGVVSYAPAFG